MSTMRVLLLKAEARIELPTDAFEQLEVVQNIRPKVDEAMEIIRAKSGIAFALTSEIATYKHRTMVNSRPSSNGRGRIPLRFYEHTGAYSMTYRLNHLYLKRMNDALRAAENEKQIKDILKFNSEIIDLSLTEEEAQGVFLLAEEIINQLNGVVQQTTDQPDEGTENERTEQTAA